MTTETQSAAVLRRAMYTACGDDLERANLQFGNWSDAQLDSPYGQSGRTGRQIWQDYKDARVQHETANNLLEEMLQARGL